MPSLTSGRLTLVAIDPGLAQAQLDGPDILAACLGAAPPSAWPPEPFDAEIVAWCRDSLARDPGGVGWYGWLLLEDQGGPGPVLVGAAGLLGRPDFDGEVEVGFGILPEHQGKGLGAQALAALTRWAQARGARTVVAHVPADHETGRRALQKNGFSAESQPYPGVARFVLDASLAR